MGVKLAFPPPHSRNILRGMSVCQQFGKLILVIIVAGVTVFATHFYPDKLHIAGNVSDWDG
ncbi:hypothetical protein LAM01_04990 [Amylolactobacillus amylophilus]|nr:hypothetical protein LAM01_04990 [Amylolactobacillus amylophilus]